MRFEDWHMDEVTQHELDRADLRYLGSHVNRLAARVQILERREAYLQRLATAALHVLPQEALDLIVERRNAGEFGTP